MRTKYREEDVGWCLDPKPGDLVAFGSNWVEVSSSCIASAGREADSEAVFVQAWNGLEPIQSNINKYKQVDKL